MHEAKVQAGPRCRRGATIVALVVAVASVLAGAPASAEVAVAGTPLAGWRADGVTTAVLELPTGGLADAVGRRPVLLIATVAATLVGICTLASFAGSLLPLVAKRIGIDPAVVSSPLITTLVDASGLILYFLIAYAVLGNQIAG